MSSDWAKLLDNSKPRPGRRVVIEHFERVTANCVEAAFARRDCAIMRVGRANIELKSTTLEIGVKALDALNRRIGRDDFLFWRGGHWRLSIGYGEEYADKKSLCHG
jgi:hypothetical protein